MKKVDWHFCTRSLGDCAGTLYVDENATDKEIRNAIYDEVEFCCFWEAENGYEPYEFKEIRYKKKESDKDNL
jgi:hypothetical protein